MAVFRVVVGTYDKSLIGFECRETGDNERPIKMRTLFAYAAHDGCVKSLSCTGSMLVSGSTDEQIKFVPACVCM